MFQKDRMSTTYARNMQWNSQTISRSKMKKNRKMNICHLISIVLKLHASPTNYFFKMSQRCCAIVQINIVHWTAYTPA